MNLIGSIIFTTQMFLTVPFYALPLILVRPFGLNASWIFVRAWLNLQFACLRIFCGLTYRVEGEENLPDEPSVVFIKHSSAFETMAQMLVLPMQVWVLKRELMWAPFLGWALACCHPIAINRKAGKSAVEQVVSQGKRRLEQGLWVTIFPEGTRMPLGTTKRYGISGAVLASEAGVKVVPLAHDAAVYWPRRGLRKKPGEIRVVFGPPIETAGREPREINEEAQAWIEAKVAELTGAEVAASPPRKAR